MLVTKEVIGPATHWYRDETSGLPRKLVVTPELTKYWAEQGNKMLSLGLTVPVPCEHDFNANPMTPADKLKNNAGWVKEFRLDKDILFAIVDVQDEEIAKKLPKTIRWTSPWISSFTDGQGRAWQNVISHLALTTRPRIVKQAPFPSIAAAMSFALGMPESKLDADAPAKDGLCISKAGRLVEKGKKLCPEFPIAFSLYSGGIALSDDDIPPDKPKGKDDSPPPDANPLDDQTGDVTMPQLLSDLMSVLGVQLPDNVGSDQFMRALYTAVIAKIKELGGNPAMGDTNNQPNTGNNQTPPNPLITQEQQPMYMSLEEIQKIPDETMRNVALSMFAENKKLADQLAAQSKEHASLRDAKIREENAKRQLRVERLCRMSPSLKNELTAMFTSPTMALSMGEAGTTIDPMGQTLTMLEKGLADMPRLLQVDQSALSVQQQPTDGEMSAEQEDALADSMARMMGCPPEAKKAG